MKSFGVLFLVLVLFAAIGFYQGWFSMSSNKGDAGSRKVDVKMTVDGDKMEADADAVKSKVQELTGEAKDKASQLGQPATDASNKK